MIRKYPSSSFIKSIRLNFINPTMTAECWTMERKDDELMNTNEMTMLQWIGYKALARDHILRGQTSYFTIHVDYHFVTNL